MYSRSHCFARMASRAAPRLMTRLKKNSPFIQRAELDGCDGDGDKRLEIVALIAGGMLRWLLCEET